MDINECPKYKINFEQGNMGFGIKKNQQFIDNNISCESVLIAIDSCEDKIENKITNYDSIDKTKT